MNENKEYKQNRSIDLNNKQMIHISRLFNRTLHNIHIDIMIHTKKNNRFLWQVIISHAWTTHFLSTSHMSHLTPNLYIAAAAVVVVNSVRSSFFFLPSAIINKQLARTNNKYSRINLRLSSIFAYFFFALIIT